MASGVVVRSSKGELVNTKVLFLWPPVVVIMTGGFLLVLVGWCMMFFRRHRCMM